MSRAAAVNALAVGMCKGDGCQCPVGPPGGRWCIAESVYGSWAESALAGVEAAGYVFMPTRPTAEPPRRRRHPETGRALALCLETAVEAALSENRPGAPSARFHDPEGPTLPDTLV